MKKMHDLNGEISLFENNDNDVRKRTKLQSPEFDLRRGSHLALSNSSELSSYHQTLALSCSSLALHFKHHSMKFPHTSYGLIRNDVMLDILAKIPFENQNYSQPLECIVQIHKDERDCVEGDTSGSSISINSAYVQKVISSSSLPGIGDAFTFAPPLTELLNALNMDFLQPATIFTIADLPSNQGYGISDTSIAKTASNILQCMAIAVMLRKPLSNEEIKNVIDQHAPKTQQNPAIVTLLAHLNTRVTRNPLGIATFLSSISIHAHNSLSVANRKISDNVEVKLMKLFGSGL